MTCAICLEAASTRAWRRLACGHGFHEGCILRWVQHSHHGHCPMCRSDLEASALSEFEADFNTFQKDLESWNAAPSERSHELNLALVGAERCRRRLYDAALARFLKLMGMAAQGDSPLLQEVRGLVNELLHELHRMREVLERRRGSRLGAKSQVGLHSGDSCSKSAALDAELLDILGGELSHFHQLLKRLCTSDADRQGESLDTRLANQVSNGLREHLAQVRKLCKHYLELVPKPARPNLGGA